MLPSRHILAGFLISIILYIAGFSLVQSLVFFLSSFLIDVDHYLYYVYRKKDLSLKRSFNWYLKLDKKYFAMPKITQAKYYAGFCIFHGIESIIILFILGIFYPILNFVALGFIAHLFLDAIQKIREDQDSLEVLSIIYKYFYNLKRRNIDSA